MKRLRLQYLDAVVVRVSDAFGCIGIHAIGKSHAHILCLHFTNTFDSVVCKLIENDIWPEFNGDGKHEIEHICYDESWR